MIRLLSSLIFGAAGGVAMWLGFPGPIGGWWPLVFVGLAILLGLTRGRGSGQAAVASLAWGLAFFVPHTVWAREAVGTAGPWLALAGVEIAMTVVWAWSIGLASTRTWVRAHPWAWLVIVSVTYAGLEQLRAHVPYGGFGWGIVAYPQVDSPLGALAPYIGETGLSIVTTALAAACVLIVFPLARLRTRIAAIGAVAITALATPAVPNPAMTHEGDVTVALVQGNVPQPVKEVFGTGRVLDNHIRQTRASVSPGQVDVVMWGEHAADRDPLTDPNAGARLDQLLADIATPLLYGAVGREGDIRWGEYRLANHPEVTYRKRHPVPFGEYLPNREFYSRLTSEVRQIGHDMRAGSRPGVIPVATRHGTVRFGVALCFEVAFDRHVREDVTEGAQVLLVPTNNALFGETAESAQQLQMTRLRAREYARAAIQVSTQGVSGIVDPEGRLLARTQLFTARTLTETLPVTSTRTWAARHGQILEMLSMGVALAWAGAMVLASPVLTYRRRIRSTKGDRR